MAESFQLFLKDSSFLDIWQISRFAFDSGQKTYYFIWLLSFFMIPLSIDPYQDYVTIIQKSGKSIDWFRYKCNISLVLLKMGATS